MHQTENYINAMAEYFDQSVATASDDQLFAAGYLRGHIDLAVGTLQLREQPFSVDTLQQQVAQSLQQKAGFAISHPNSGRGSRRFAIGPIFRPVGWP